MTQQINPRTKNRAPSNPAHVDRASARGQASMKRTLAGMGAKVADAANLPLARADATHRIARSGR